MDGCGPSPQWDPGNSLKKNLIKNGNFSTVIVLQINSVAGLFIQLTTYFSPCYVPHTASGSGGLGDPRAVTWIEAHSPGEEAEA